MKHKLQSHLTLCLLMLCSALSMSAQNKGNKINLAVDKMELTKALSQVERQSGYYKINYSYEELNPYKVSAVIKDKNTVDAVKILLNRLPYTVSVDGKFIQIKSNPRNAKKAGATVQGGLRGRITDENGDPQIGATVKVIGSDKITVTDIDGNFYIADANPDDQVEISYIGKKTIRRKVGTKKMDIIIADDENLLEDVLVTGYQSIKKEDATGSFQKVTSRDLDKRTTTDIMSNLEGQVPGLTTYSTGINGSGEEAMSIRGISTFQARTNPLVVVDGLPIEGSIESVNPYDIESINILKDAAAAAIYGARASNGVIVITTKKAKQSKIEVNFSADLTIAEKQTYDNYNYCNASQTVDAEEMNMDAVFADPTGAMYESFYWPTYKSYYSPAALLYMQHRDGSLSDADYNSAMNKLRQNDYVKYYRDNVLREKVTQQYNVSVRSKTDKMNNSLIANYKGDNKGIVNEHNRTFNFTFKNEYKVTKWLTTTAGIKIDYNMAKTHFEPYNSSFLSSPYSFPVYSDGNSYLRANFNPNDEILSDETYGFKSLGYNVKEQLNYNFTRTNSLNSRAYIHLDFHLAPWLNFTSQFQHEKIKQSSESELEKGSYAMNYVYDLYTSGGKHYLPDAGMLYTSNRDGNYLTWRNQLNFNKEFGGKHNVSAIAGMELRQTKLRTLKNALIGYDDATQTNYMASLDLYSTNKLSSSDLYSSMGSIAPNNYYNLLYIGGSAFSGAAFGSSDVTHRFASFYGSANYTYDHRYAASLSVRLDKTDLFGADPKYRGRPLWSAGLSWNLHNESFMKDLSNIDMLKLRLSYGVTGNIDSSVSSYLVGRYATSSIVSGKYAYLSTPPNDQLRWEKTASWNFGIDYSFFDHFVSGSLDFYRKYSSDILSSTALDPSEGFTSLTINNGEACNKGVELQMNLAILKAKSRNEVGVDLGFNFAYNVNKVTKVTYTQSALTVLGWGQSSHALIEGNAINSLYALRYAGHAEDGQTQWYRADGTATTDMVWDIDSKDVVCMGTLDPKYTFNLTPSVSYKGFTLSAMLSYYGGHVMRANVYDWLTSASLTGLGNSYKCYYQYLTDPDNYELPYPSIYNYLNSMNTGQSLMYFDGAVVSADYMKLRNIVLTYDIPRTFCHNLGIGSARVRFQMNNVAKWVKNDLGVDPEANNPWTGSPQNAPMRSYTMNLTVNF